MRKKLALTLTLLPLAFSFGALDTSDLETATQSGIKTVGAGILALTGIGYAILLLFTALSVVKAYTQTVNKAKNDPTIENPQVEGIKSAFVSGLPYLLIWILVWIITNAYVNPLRPDRVLMMLIERIG